MRIRIAICTGSIVAAIGAWTVIASHLFVWMGGLFTYFPRPLTTWWRYALQPRITNTTLFYLIASGIAAAVPIVLLTIAIAISCFRRRKSRLAPPSGGGVRPIEPGVTDNHGHATILTDKEALRRFPGPPGMVIGEVLAGKAGTAPLVIDPILADAGNGVVVAGNGAGKSSSLVSMLMYWPGSAVVLDPKMELAGMMRDALEADGRRVEVVSTKVPGSGFNAIGWIDPTKPLAELDIKQCIAWIFPDDKEEAAGNRDPYFEPTGKSLCAAILADLVWSDRPAHEKTLTTFRSIVVTPEDKMRKVMQSIAVRSKSPLARDLASTLKGITPKQWSGVYGQAVMGTEWLSISDLAQLVAGDRFNVQDMMDGNTVVFAQIPLKTMMQAPGAGRVIIGSILNAIYEVEQTHGLRTGFFLDEAWSLGRMQLQRAALVTGRSFGATIIWFYQAVGQMKEIWGENGISTLYNNLAWRAYVAVKDHKAAEEISQDIGDISVMAYSEGDNTGTQSPAGLGWGSRSTGKTTNVHEIKRRLVLPQEIKNAPRDHMFVIAGDSNMRLRMPLYFRRPDLAAVVHPSRLHRPERVTELVVPGSAALSPAHLHTRR